MRLPPAEPSLRHSPQMLLSGRKLHLLWTLTYKTYFNAVVGLNNLNPVVLVHHAGMKFVPLRHDIAKNDLGPQQEDRV